MAVGWCDCAAFTDRTGTFIGFTGYSQMAGTIRSGNKIPLRLHLHTLHFLWLICLVVIFNTSKKTELILNEIDKWCKCLINKDDKVDVIFILSFEIKD